MNKEKLIQKYNYDDFTPIKVVRWHRFDSSPLLGETLPNFPLWHLDGSETSLETFWKANSLTIIEFGSFT